MSNQHDELRVHGVMAAGYGVMPKSVMQDTRLTIEAKAIYAYIASYAGTGTTAFPGKRKIAADLKISEERLYTHRKQLIKYGYITVTQERGPGGTLGKTVYTLEPIAIERPDAPDTGKPSSEKPRTENPRTEKPRTENPSHNNNSSKINSLNNNKMGKRTESGKAAAPSPSEIVDLFHLLCPSYSKIVKLTDGRQTAIKARLAEYSLEQIKQAFVMAEESNFLKGQNDRGWKANFDWLVKPGNMVKVLEGNYVNKPGKPTQPKATTDRYAKIEEEETL